ncbi:aldehyde dehydrogenase family protein [Arthrobacter sp. NPDC055138]
MPLLSHYPADAPQMPRRDWQMFIDGTPVAGTHTRRIVDPGTGETIAEVAVADESHIDQAVQAARRTFDSGVWASMPGDERAQVLWRIADIIDQRADEIALVEAYNLGAPYHELRQRRIPEAARVFRYYAGWIDKITGVAMDLRRPGAEYHAYTQRKPAGAVGLITSWNSPFGMGSWKVAPALAAGCSAVLKPSEVTPLTSILMGEIALEAGLPGGVLNVVVGEGARVGRAMVEHPGLDKISFTGSTATGREIAMGALTNMKKVTLELGGKSPVLVFADANLDEAIAGAAGAIFSNAGQVCTAGSRLLIADEVYDEVVAGLTERAQNLKVGYAFDGRSEMGPVVSDRQYQTVTGFIGSALDAGASLNTQLEQSDRGFFISPTVITEVKPDMEVVREEIFGPVVVAMRFRDEAEAVALANDSRYGLAASVWTNDIRRAHRVAGALRVGRIGLNVHASPDTTMPTGGFKESGWGKELGPDGIQEYLETSSVFTKIA